MVLSKDVKGSKIQAFRRHDTDTGSADVQIALLSEKIKVLTGHFGTHAKDHSSRRGLLRMVSRRRRLLGYLKKHDEARYKELIGQLGIRK